MRFFYFINLDGSPFKGLPLPYIIHFQIGVLSFDQTISILYQGIPFFDNHLPLYDFS